MWAGSAYPESIFLGAAICWVLNGFSGPNYINNVKRKYIRITNFLLMCLYFFRKKNTGEKKRHLSKPIMQNDFNFTFPYDYWISFLFCYFTQQWLTQLLGTARFMIELSSLYYWYRRQININYLTQNTAIQYVMSTSIQKTKPQHTIPCKGEISRKRYQLILNSHI